MGVSLAAGGLRPGRGKDHGPRLADLQPGIVVDHAETGRYRAAQQGRNVVVGCSDALGGMGQLMATPEELRASTGMGYHMKYRAQLFANRQLAPVFTPQKQEKSLACLYEDRDGRRYRYTTTTNVQQMTGPDGKPLYQRITGLNEFARGDEQSGDFPRHRRSEHGGMNTRRLSCFKLLEKQGGVVLQFDKDRPVVYIDEHRMVFSA